MSAWARYVAALAAWRMAETPANRRALGNAYADFVSEFCPESAEELIAEFAGRLNRLAAAGEERAA